MRFLGQINQLSKLWDHVVCVYGSPEHVNSVQGANFESEFLISLVDAQKELFK